LPDFSWYDIPKRIKIFQNTTKYTKFPSIIPNGHKVAIPNLHKIYQHLQLQVPPKFTKIWIFGLKTNHLATLDSRVAGTTA
jgi:hypothetical protein